MENKQNNEIQIKKNKGTIKVSSNPKITIHKNSILKCVIKY